MSTPPDAPRWALVIGTLGLCFGAVGFVGGASDIAMPYLVAIQQQAVTQVTRSLEDPAGEPAARADGGPVAELAGRVSALLARPGWYGRYARAMAVVRALLGAALMWASTCLILVRPGADRLFMAVTGASAVRNLVAAAAGLAAGSVLVVITVAAGLLGFLVDAGLLLACRLSPRAAYRPRAA
jgi:hypothetical protein